MTLSIGVATLRQAADYKVLIKKADDMLLRSKQEGRNRITVDRFDRRAEGGDRRRT
jgi:PleD family two-component response regulator